MSQEQVVYAGQVVTVTVLEPAAVDWGKLTAQIHQQDPSRN